MTAPAPPKWDVVVVGGINTDYLGSGPALPTPGATVRGDLFRICNGGKGANQAVTVARLGGRVALIGLVGDDDRGEALRAHLDREGVSLDRVGVATNTPSGAALIQIETGGEKQILAIDGAGGALTIAQIDAATPELTATRVVLACLEPSVAVVTRALALGRKAGALTVLDPSPPVPLPDDLLRLVDVIKPDATEARVLTGIDVHDQATAQRAADALLQRGVGAVAIQAGSAGNLLVWPGGERFLPLIPIHSIDTTGAGDAFAGALAYELAQGRTLTEAGPVANAAAALATTAVGAQASLPTMAQVQALLGEQGGVRS